MKKVQVTLFGSFAKPKTKKYICYKNPQGNYECFVERYCLHNVSRIVKKVIWLQKHRQNGN